MTETEKFTTPCPLPTERERELLTILIEECGEVIQRATKMLRFGVAEVQPGQPNDNRERLSHEVGDLQVMVELCCAAGLLSPVAMSDGRSRKLAQLARFMQT